MAELASKPDVLEQAFSCRDCHVRALEDEIRQLRERDSERRDRIYSLEQEIACRERFPAVYAKVPAVQLIERAGALLYVRNVHRVRWSDPGHLLVEFER